MKVAKDYSFRDDIYQLVDHCCTTGQVTNCQLPSYQKKVRETKGKVRLLMLGLLLGLFLGLLLGFFMHWD